MELLTNERNGELRFRFGLRLGKARYEANDERSREEGRFLSAEKLHLGLIQHWQKFNTL